MFGKFLAIPALGLAVLTLPQSCSQVDLSHPGDAAFTLAIDDAFGFKSEVRGNGHPPPPPPPPPNPCDVPNPPPHLCGGSS